MNIKRKKEISVTRESEGNKGKTWVFAWECRKERALAGLKSGKLEWKQVTAEGV